MFRLTPQPTPSPLQLLVSTSGFSRRDLLPDLCPRHIPLRMRIPLRLRTRRTARDTRRLTRLRNWAVRIDRGTINRTDFVVFSVFGEELFPVGEGAEFLFGEATKVVGEVGLEATGDECSRSVATGPVILMI